MSFTLRAFPSHQLDATQPFPVAAEVDPYAATEPLPAYPEAALAALDLEPNDPLVLVRHYGGPISHGVLASGVEHFAHPDARGLIGYRRGRRLWLVLGDPVAPPDASARLADELAIHCHEHDIATVVMAASYDTAVQMAAHGFGSIQLAEELFCNPQHDPEVGQEAQDLQQKCNKGRGDGVVVFEYRMAERVDPELEAELAVIHDRWAAERRGPEVFLSSTQLLDARFGRRWFCARVAGRLVGALSLVRVGAASGGLMVNLVFAAPDAPVGTSELLVVETLRTLRSEGVSRVSFGLVPLPAIGSVSGFGPVSGWLAHTFYRWACNRYHLAGKRSFWEGFGIESTAPLYVLCRPARLDPLIILSILRAFNA